MIQGPLTTSNFALALALHCAGCRVPKDGDTPVPLVCIYDEDILRGLGYHGITLESAARLAFMEGRRGEVGYSFERVPVLEKLLIVFNQWRGLLYTREGVAARFIGLAEVIHETSDMDTAVIATVISLEMRKLIGEANAPVVDPAAFRNQTALLNESKETISDEILRVLTIRRHGKMSDTECVSRLFCTIIRARALLGDMWKQYEPWLRIRHTGRTESRPTGDGGRVEKVPGWILCPLNADAATKRRLGL